MMTSRIIEQFCPVQQLTFAPRQHHLTNSQVWSADSQWLAYDLRSSEQHFDSQTVERININSLQQLVIYHAKQGAHVGVVTASPALPQRYVFIHGPEQPTEQWQYSFHHRRGVMVDEQQHAMTLDACSLTAPYTLGALRGGSHVHMFSHDGSRLSFTYHDHVVWQNNPAEDQRNVAVALPLGPVDPRRGHPREYAGSHYCVLISQTVAQALPGSSQIERAYEEGWVGNHGYCRHQGQQQRWAIAFIGDTRGQAGQRISEVFIVDLPEALAAYQQAGHRPIEGTERQLPAPPAGIVQRRLTFTEHRRFPGLVTEPRHWLRSCADGSVIAFLMKDQQGITQLWGISPNGGEPMPLSQLPFAVQSAFTWHPWRRCLVFVADNSVMQLDIDQGVCYRLTAADPLSPPLPQAVVYAPDGNKVAYMRNIGGFQQLFVLNVSV